MTGNGHARFLGGRAAATPLLLPGTTLQDTVSLWNLHAVSHDHERAYHGALQSVQVSDQREYSDQAVLYIR